MGTHVQPQGSPGHRAECQEWRKGKAKVPQLTTRALEAGPHSFEFFQELQGLPGGRKALWEVPPCPPTQKTLASRDPPEPDLPLLQSLLRLPLAPGMGSSPCLTHPTPTPSCIFLWVSAHLTISLSSCQPTCFPDSLCTCSFLARRPPSPSAQLLAQSQVLWPLILLRGPRLIPSSLRSHWPGRVTDGSPEEKNPIQ